MQIPGLAIILREIGGGVIVEGEVILHTLGL